MILPQRLPFALLMVLIVRRNQDSKAFLTTTKSSSFDSQSTYKNGYHYFHDIGSRGLQTVQSCAPSQTTSLSIHVNQKHLAVTSNLLMSSSTNSVGDNVDGLNITNSADPLDATTSLPIIVPKQGNIILRRIRRIFTSTYRKRDDDLTFRQRLTKMGLAAILSYGFVSNMSYAVTVSIAWYIHNIQTKCSPLLKGQWKQFLLVYSGFWVFNNIVRPIRLAISVGIVAPQFDRLLLFMQQKFNVSRTASIAITVFMANVVCTITVMSFGILLASILSGVPVFP